MGQSATLYRIKQSEFERLSKEPTSFSPRMTEGHVTFEQNFEGLLFLLSKLCPNSDLPLIREIFYPGDSIGRTIDSADFDVLDDLSFLETESISYLSIEKIHSIKIFLDTIDKHQLLSLFDPEELNSNGVYPCVWHNDESPDRAFNKGHIEEGFDKLVALYNDAVKNRELILGFVG